MNNDRKYKASGKHEHQLIFELNTRYCFLSIKPSTKVLHPTSMN